MKAIHASRVCSTEASGSRLEQAVKSWTRHGMYNYEPVLAIVADTFRRTYPAIRISKIVILLQVPARGWRGPINDCRVGQRLADREQRRAHRLNRQKAPESSNDRIMTALRRLCGIVLANRAAYGVNTAGAHAATAGNFEPVDSIWLSACRMRLKDDNCDSKDNQSAFHIQKFVTE